MYYHYGNTYYKHFIFIILLTFVNRKCKSCKIFVITICNFVNYTLRNSNYRKSFIRSRDLWDLLHLVHLEHPEHPERPERLEHLEHLEHPEYLVDQCILLTLVGQLDPVDL
jgi:hypothetical protein